MPDRQAFLDAIRHAPAEDAPRLIYADWLDDNGDSDRADFIRFSVAASDWPPLPRAGFDLDAARRFGIKTGQSHIGRFHRGFLDPVMLTTRGGVGHAVRLRAVEPMPTLDVRYSPNVDLPGFAELVRDAPRVIISIYPRAGDFLARLAPFSCRRVSVEPGVWDLPDLEMFPLAEEVTASWTPPHLQPFLDGVPSRVRGLRIDNLRCDPDDQSPIRWPDSLKQLSVKFYTPADADALLKSEPWPRLQRVSLGFNTGLRPADAARVADWPGAGRITELGFESVVACGSLGRLWRATPALERLAVFFPEWARRTRLPAGPGVWPALRNLRLYGVPDDTSGGLASLASRCEVLRLPWSPAFFTNPVWQRGSAVRRLCLEGASDEEVRRVVELPALAGLEALHVWNGSPKVTAPTIRAIARSPCGPNLRALVLNQERPTLKVIDAAMRHFGPRCDVYWQAEASQ